MCKMALSVLSRSQHGCTIACRFVAFVLLGFPLSTETAHAQTTTPAPAAEPAPEPAGSSASTPTASFKGSRDEAPSAPPDSGAPVAEEAPAPEPAPPSTPAVEKAPAPEPAPPSVPAAEPAKGNEPAPEPSPAAAPSQTDLAAAEVLEGQRFFGLGPSGLVYAGFGGTVTLGLRNVFLSAGIGWQPILIIVQNMTDASMDIKFFSTSQIDADLMAIVAHPEPRLGIGFTGGYRKNSLLGHGVALGAALTYELSRHLRVLGMAGLMVFPRGEDNIEDHLDVCDGMAFCDYEFGFPGPNLQDGLGGALVYYP